jgi:hypothetical protein
MLSMFRRRCDGVCGRVSSIIIPYNNKLFSNHRSYMLTLPPSKPLKPSDVVPPIEFKLPTAALVEFDILRVDSISRYNTVCLPFSIRATTTLLFPVLNNWNLDLITFIFSQTFILGQSSSLATQEKVTSIQLSLFSVKSSTPAIVLVLPI